MQENKKVKLTLTGAVNYKSEISLNTAASILHLCSVTLEGKDDTKTLLSEFQQEEKVSLGEYVHKHQPTTYPEKIVAIAAYQQKIKGRESFSPEDIRPLFKDIGEVPQDNRIRAHTYDGALTHMAFRENTCKFIRERTAAGYDPHATGRKQ